MKIKERPFYKRKYQMELANELTGRSNRAIYAFMKRNSLSLVETIKEYLKKEL